MMTFLYQTPYTNNFYPSSFVQNTSPIDLYLGEPIGPYLSDFPATIQKQLTTSELQHKYYNNNTINELLSQYGRFWIDPNMNILYYHLPGGKDIQVQHLTVGKGLNSDLIVRVNGHVIPTIALEQLRILLNRFNIYPNLLNNINVHRSKLNNTIRPIC